MNRLAQLIASVCCVLVTAQPALAAEDTGETELEQWQENALFAPGKAQVRRESAGQVVIYDGIADKVVQRAMDEQFHRVENMMFTRVVVTDDSGAPRTDDATGQKVYEHDGCN